MSGLDEILKNIDLKQKEAEKGITDAADKRINAIHEEAELKAQTAYSEYMEKASKKNRLDFENACSSADSAMKRKILAFKVEQIDKAIENTISRLHSLETPEYFALLEKLIAKHISSGEGIVSLNASDLKRMPADFEKNICSAAESKGGSITLSREAADIDDGFILSYGKIIENCSFRAIIEAEKEDVRDTAAKALFG